MKKRKWCLYVLTFGLSIAVSYFTPSLVTASETEGGGSAELDPNAAFSYACFCSEICCGDPCQDPDRYITYTDGASFNTNLTPWLMNGQWAENACVNSGDNCSTCGSYTVGPDN